MNPTEPVKGIIAAEAERLGVTNAALTNAYFKRTAGLLNARQAAEALNVEPLNYRHSEIKITQAFREHDQT